MTAEVEMLRNVLIGLDGSKLAEAALESAVKVARARSGTLILFQAVAPAESASLAAAEHVQRQRARADEYLRALAAPLKQAAASVEELVVTGDAAREIVSQAHRQGAGLIVLSSHGGGRGGTWPFGSVAEKVLRTTTLPVLVFRGEPFLPTKPHKMLIPLDGSEGSLDVLPPASEVADALGASVVLAHVGTHAPRFVYQAVDAVRNRGIPVKMRLLHGEPAPSLLAAASEEQADLVAITTAGADLANPAFVGDVGRRILSGSSYPLLIVRPRSAA